MSKSDWLLKKLLKTAIELANTKSSLGILNERLNEVELEHDAAEERCEALRLQKSERFANDSAVVVELKARIAEMSPQKMFRVVRKYPNPNVEGGVDQEILSVYSAGGVTTLTIR
jgi:hypothetical protein